jgi:membrane fusion protein, multidrug efflux system
MTATHLTHRSEPTALAASPSTKPDPTSRPAAGFTAGIRRAWAMRHTVNRRAPRRPASVPAVLALVAAFGCHREQPAPPPPPAVQLAPADVIVVKNQTVESGPLVSGTLEAADSATVRAQLGGTIKKVGPELGQTVQKGALLAEIDARSLGDQASSARAQVAAAQAQLEVARREVERTRALVAAGAIARRELEAAESRATAQQAAVDQARAQLSTAAKQLGDATVRAPMAGAVAQRAVNTGDVVTPGATLYQIIDPSSVRLSASVPSDQIGALKVGLPVRFTVHGYPDQAFTGQVSRIAPSADPTTKQIAILVDLPNPEHQLLAGLYARARIAAQTATGVVVPLSAVDSRSNPPAVLRVSGTTVERVEVKLGLRDLMRDEVVVSGLRPGDRILARVTAAPPAGTHVVPPPTS